MDGLSGNTEHYQSRSLDFERVYFSRDITSHFTLIPSPNFVILSCKIGCHRSQRMLRAFLVVLILRFHLTKKQNMFCLLKITSSIQST